jgi:hypothetical protein
VKIGTARAHHSKLAGEGAAIGRRASTSLQCRV